MARKPAYRECMACGAPLAFEVVQGILLVRTKRTPLGPAQYASAQCPTHGTVHVGVLRPGLKPGPTVSPRARAYVGGAGRGAPDHGCDGH